MRRCTLCRFRQPPSAFAGNVLVCRDCVRSLTRRPVVRKARVEVVRLEDGRVVMRRAGGG